MLRATLTLTMCVLHSKQYMYAYNFKDLCVARCIHALESGNCTSRGGLGQMSLVNWLPNVSTQSRVFISGNEIQGMVTYIPVGGGAKWAGKMGGKLKVWVVMWVMGGAVNK